MKMLRREFLKKTTGMVPLLLIGSVEVTSQSKRYTMFIDTSKCYGCMACAAACFAENNVPIGVFRTWIERFVKPKGNVVFVPKQCNQCDNPSCVKVCPTGATFKNVDGLVLIDDKICIGCGACIQNCPYGARYVNPVKGIADKCTFCDHRLARDLLPACVVSCPTAARIFGDLNDETNEATKMVNSAQLQVVKQRTGNRPQIYYKGLPVEADV